MWDGEGGAGGEGGGGEGEGGQAAPVDYRLGLSEELRSAPVLQDIGDVASLAQNYVDQSVFLGNAIRPPGPDASDEDKAAFFAKVQEHAGTALVPRPDPEDAESREAFAKAMGRPDEATGYAAPEIENFNAEMFDAARPLFHKLGLTQEQAAGLAEYRHQEMTDQYNAIVATMTQQHSELQQEWGMTYQPRLEALTTWLTAENAPKEITEGVKEMPTSQIKFLHSLMARLGAGEGQTQHQHGGADGGAMAPAEALARANELMTRLHKMNPGDTEYAGLAAKRVEYMKLAYPDSEVGLTTLRSQGVDASQISA